MKETYQATQMDPGNEVALKIQARVQLAIMDYEKATEYASKLPDKDLLDEVNRAKKEHLLQEKALYKKMIQGSKKPQQEEDKQQAEGGEPEEPLVATEEVPAHEAVREADAE